MQTLQLGNMEYGHTYKLELYDIGVLSNVIKCQTKSNQVNSHFTPLVTQEHLKINKTLPVSW